MSDSVGHAHARCPCTDRSGEQRAQRIGIGPGRVLGDVHHRQPFPYGECDRVFRALLQEIEAPPFRVLANRARPDKRTALDRHAGALRDLGDRLDVGHHGPRGAVGPDLQLFAGDRPRQPLHVARHVRTGARQTDVDRVDAKRVHAAQDIDLLLDRRRPDGRRLQPVPQRLVVQHGDRARTGSVVVPVVNQRVRRDAQEVTCDP